MVVVVVFRCEKSRRVNQISFSLSLLAGATDHQENGYQKNECHTMEHHISNLKFNFEEQKKV